MGLAEVCKVTLIVPEYRVSEAIRDLYRFEWFHIEEHGVELDERVSKIHDTLRKLRSELDYLVSTFNITVEVGVIQQLLKGYQVRKEKIEVSHIEELIEKIEAEVRPLISTAKESIERAKKLREDIRNVEVLLSSLRLLKDYKIDLTVLEKFKRFYGVFSITEQKNIAEIKRSLPTCMVLDIPLEKGVSALLIISLKEDGEKVERVLRGFGVKAFSIPPELPQNLQEAYKILEERYRNLLEELKESEEKLAEIRVNSGPKILALREAVQIVEELLSKLNVKTGFRRFKVINGYVPKDFVEKFKEEFDKKYCVLFSEAGHHKHDENAPTLLKNKGLMKSFENIVAIQGYPRSDEIDPTPYVAIFFSIFYGLMYADLGQGLILALFGFFMYKRVYGNLKEWAKLLTILGISAAIAGFIIGEAFGFKIHFPFPKPEVLHLVEEHGAERQFNMSEVLKLMNFTLFLGIIHIVTGYTLAFRKALKHGDYVEAFLSKLPTIIMYISGVLFVLCFFGAGKDMGKLMSSENPVPYLGVPVKVLSPTAIGMILASILVLVLGRAIVESLLWKKGGFIGLAGNGLLEVLDNIIHFMSNSLSYVRLTILLLVHSALLLLLNTTWQALGFMSLPILIIGNIGIMALEGLMVFIQALRLHLYEFFTKFYEGTGTLFKKIKPSSNYIDIVFRE